MEPFSNSNVRGGKKNKASEKPAKGAVEMSLRSTTKRQEAFEVALFDVTCRNEPFVSVRHVNVL